MRTLAVASPRLITNWTRNIFKIVHVFKMNGIGAHLEKNKFHNLEAWMDNFVAKIWPSNRLIVSSSIHSERGVDMNLYQGLSDVV